MTALFRQIGEQVHAEHGDASVLPLFGRSNLAKHEQTRRVVWIPVSSPLGPPKRVGGYVHVDEHGRRSRVNDAYTLGYTFEAHVFAKDEEAGELLGGELLGALHRRFGARVRPTSWGWTTEQEGGASGVTKRQPKLVIGFVVDVPITDELKILTAIVGTRLTHTLQLPTAGT